MHPHDEELPLLIAQTGPLDGSRWEIEKTILIGRDNHCDIVVITPDKQVSRHHARITPSEDGIKLEDMGSKNGTHCNGERIDEKVILQDGDTIQIALAQQFVFLSSDATIPLELEGKAVIPSTTPILLLDKNSRRVWVGDMELMPPLSVAQFSMLELLYIAEGQVVSRQALVEAIWGEEQAYDVSNQALDALVRRLRDRIAEVDSNSFIVTVRGHGLRLDNPRK